MNEPLRIAPLVEGHGETKAVPVLVRRIVTSIAPEISLRITQPNRFKRDRLISQTSDDELRRFLQLAWFDVEKVGIALLIVDGDGQCPVELAGSLRQRAEALRPDIPLEVVVAHQEFEAWFVAAAESIRGHRQLPRGLERPPDPEAKRDAKGWLTSQLPAGASYSETIDQVEFSRRIDLTEARTHSRSFRSLWSALERSVADHRDPDQ